MLETLVTLNADRAAGVSPAIGEDVVRQACRSTVDFHGVLCNLRENAVRYRQSAFAVIHAVAQIGEETPVDLHSGSVAATAGQSSS